MIRPSLPVPETALASIPFSFNIFFAAGEAEPEAYVACAATSFSTTAGASFLAGASAGRASPLGLPSVSIRQTTWPTATASPSSALNVIVPLSSAGSSKVALSEST